MAVPAEAPLIFLAMAAVGTMATLWITAKPNKKEYLPTPAKKLMIHNLMKKTISSPLLGQIKPESHIFIDRPTLVYDSVWSIGGSPFLRLGANEVANLRQAIKNGHLYIGGISGVYVYTDQVGATAPSDGPKELVIANLTEKPLQLLGIPPVPPNTQFVYRGSLGNGLDLGSEFIDIARVFPNYVMNEPITRIVYGMVGPSPPPDYQINLTPIGMKLGERFTFMKPGGVLV